MIQPEIREEILRRLHAAEAEHGVRILFAIESGSRAWGFASPNSDYDVRFIYAHDPDWYLALDLEAQRDVIEYPIVDDIDLNGWDVRKALQLFSRSNPGFVEWIQSPITYIERGSFRAEALQLLPQLYSVQNGVQHYRSMARKNYQGFLCEPLVKTKKYFYVLRALLAAQWVASSGQAAPIEFEKLLVLLDGQPAVLAAIHALLEQKRHAPELGMGPVVPVLNAFIEAALAAEPQGLPQDGRDRLRMSMLNTLFRQVLREDRVA